MITEQIDKLEHLLRSTGAAHGEYETTVLKGVYDQDWAAWYAAWALENGFNALLNTDYTAQSLAAALTEINEAHQQQGAALGENWARFTARVLVQQHGGL